MNPRNFVTVPTFWKDDHRLNALGEDAYTLLVNVALSTDGDWRLEVDPANESHTIRTCCFQPQRRFRAWQTARIQGALSELLTAGILSRHRHDDRHWLQVAQAYRYEKGRDPLGKPREPEQPTLPGIAGMAALPAPSSSLMPAAPSLARGSEWTESRVKKSKANESRAGARENRGNRAQCAGSESRFERGPESVPGDDRWALFLVWLGPREAVQNGALWEARWRHDADVLWTARCDMLTTAENPAAAATKVFCAKWPDWKARAA